MTPELIGILALGFSLLMQLVVFVWWAAKLTNRVDHIEMWITSNEKNGQRLAVIETKLDTLMKMQMGTRHQEE